MDVPKTASDEALRELLLEEGEDFIDAAFKALLNRFPDATGGQTYTRALRDGVSKLQILYDMSMSSEYRGSGREVVGLREAFAREGIGAGGDIPWNVPSQVAEITDAEKLLAVADNDKFIEIAYWVLLKRAPDKEGIGNCHERLVDGVTRTRVLYEMFISGERRQTGVELAGLREKFSAENFSLGDLPLPSLSPSHSTHSVILYAAKSLDELLSQDDGEFVALAYVTLLGRVSTEAEQQRGQTELGAGVAKIAILSRLQMAHPKIVAAARLPGLAAALRAYAWSQRPLVGRIVKVLFEVDGDSPAERRNRATALRLTKVEAEITARLVELEERTARISTLELRIRTSRESAKARIASLERSVSALQQLLRRHDGAASPKNERVPGVKSDAAHHLDLRTEEIARDLRPR